MAIPKIKVVAYIRVSEEDKNAERDELAKQRVIVSEHIEKNNKELVRPIFEDKYLSGSDRFRPAFTQMIALGLEKQEYKEIIIKDSSRFARDERFLVDTLEELDHVGIKVYSVLESKYLSHEDIGDRFQALSNEYYIMIGKRNYKKLLSDKKESGEELGSPVYGYKWCWKRGEVPKGEINHWIIDKSKSEIVKKIFNNPQLNKKSLAKELNIPLRTLYRILENEEVYKGLIILERKRKNKVGKWEVFDTIRYKGKHEPIL